MGTEWRYFKEYTINLDESNIEKINYLEGDYIHLSYGTTSGLCDIFKEYGVKLPFYKRTKPPVSKKLELIQPSVMVDICKKAITLLKNGGDIITTYFGEQPVFLLQFDGSDFIDSDFIEKERNKYVDWLELIQEWSENGYYIAVDDNYS